MATENNNTENNNSAVDKDSSSADLSYKSQNILSSKSRKKKDAEFAKDQPSFSDRIKGSYNKLQQTNTKKLNLILIAVIALVGIGSTIGTITLINQNNPEAAEEAEEENIIMDDVDRANLGVEITDEEANAGESEIEAVMQQTQSEAETILADSSKPEEEAGKVFANRINQYLSNGDVDSAADIWATGYEYFTDRNLLRAELAMYTNMESKYYSMIEPGEIWFYERILEIADSLGDNSTREKYQSAYENAKQNAEQEEE